MSGSLSSAVIPPDERDEIVLASSANNESSASGWNESVLTAEASPSQPAPSQATPATPPSRTASSSALTDALYGVAHAAMQSGARAAGEGGESSIRRADTVVVLHLPDNSAASRNTSPQSDVSAPHSLSDVLQFEFKPADSRPDSRECVFDPYSS